MEGTKPEGKGIKEKLVILVGPKSGEGNRKKGRDPSLGNIGGEGGIIAAGSQK